MIKYFRKMSLIKITELAFGLLAVAMVCIIITGGDIFEVASHVNLSSIDSSKVKSGMYVELNVNEILDVFADDDVQRTSYYVIPYPKTKDDSDDNITLMALIVPDSFKDKVDGILLATASNLVAEDELKLNGKISRLNDKEQKLFENKALDVTDDYGLTNVQILPYCYVAVELSIWDYFAAAFAIMVLVFYVGMLIYILSGASQSAVRNFIKEKGLSANDVVQELENGEKFGPVILSEKYLAFMFRYRVYMTDRQSVTDVYQLVKDEKEGEGSLVDNIIVIKKNDGNNFVVNMKNSDLVRLLQRISKS